MKRCGAHRLNASIKMEKQRAMRKTAFTKAPKTSALAHPNVLLLHVFEAKLIERKATNRAATSLSMWNESATRVRDSPQYPTMSSVTMKLPVMRSMMKRLFRFPIPVTPLQHPIVDLMNDRKVGRVLLLDF